ncbi:MAG: 16S rRNA (guanine(966)-N(2))-methyltransferase RsmD [Pseudomonadota bacterium]
MRIVGGRFKGARLAAPGDKGGGAAALRPTSDRLRETLFNILAHGGFGDPAPPEGARVLDLFAGSGALGLEALSRGAERVQFVDDLAAARALIRTNIEALGVIGSAKLYRRDATRLGPARGAPFDLVFLDPPYGRGLGEAALASALDGGWIAPGALVVWEEAAEATPEPPTASTVLDRRAQGGSQLLILRADG